MSSKNTTPILERIPLLLNIARFSSKTTKHLINFSNVCKTWEECSTLYGVNQTLELVCVSHAILRCKVSRSTPNEKRDSLRRLIYYILLFRGVGKMYAERWGSVLLNFIFDFFDEGRIAAAQQDDPNSIPARYNGGIPFVKPSLLLRQKTKRESFENDTDDLETINQQRMILLPHTERLEQPPVDAIYGSNAVVLAGKPNENICIILPFDAFSFLRLRYGHRSESVAHAAARNTRSPQMFELLMHKLKRIAPESIVEPRTSTGGHLTASLGMNSVRKELFERNFKQPLERYKQQRKQLRDPTSILELMISENNKNRVENDDETEKFFEAALLEHLFLDRNDRHLNVFLFAAAAKSNHQPALRFLIDKYLPHQVEMFKVAKSLSVAPSQVKVTNLFDMNCELSIIQALCYAASRSVEAMATLLSSEHVQAVFENFTTVWRHLDRHGRKPYVPNSARLILPLCKSERRDIFAVNPIQTIFALGRIDMLKLVVKKMPRLLGIVFTKHHARQLLVMNDRSTPMLTLVKSKHLTNQQKIDFLKAFAEIISEDRKFILHKDNNNEQSTTSSSDQPLKETCTNGPNDTLMIHILFGTIGKIPRVKWGDSVLHILARDDNLELFRFFVSLEDENCLLPLILGDTQQLPETKIKEITCTRNQSMFTANNYGFNIFMLCAKHNSKRVCEYLMCDKEMREIFNTNFATEKVIARHGWRASAIDLARIAGATWNPKDFTIFNMFEKRFSATSKNNNDDDNNEQQKKKASASSSSAKMIPESTRDRSGKNLFHQACAKGKVELVKEFIAAPNVLNLILDGDDNFGNSVLLTICDSSAWIFDERVNVTRLFYPVFDLVKKSLSSAEELKNFVNRKNKNGYTALHACAANVGRKKDESYLEVMKVLLDHGADKELPMILPGSTKKVNVADYAETQYKNRLDILEKVQKILK